MPRAIALVLSLTLSGCAVHRAPVTRGPDPLHDWASVAALPRGTPVRATVNYEIGGSLDEVTDTALTIIVRPDMRRVTISRALVGRVAVLAPKKMPWRWLAKPLAAGICGGLVGVIVGGVRRDGTVARRSFAVFALSAIAGYLHFLHHVADHEWRPVYVRR
jgi:hypothetical protein